MICSRFGLVLATMLVLALVPRSSNASLIGDSVDIEGLLPTGEVNDVTVIDPGVEYSIGFAGNVEEIDIFDAGFTWSLGGSGSSSSSGTLQLNDLHWVGMPDGQISSVDLISSQNAIVGTITWTPGPCGVLGCEIRVPFSVTLSSGQTASAAFSITAHVPEPSAVLLGGLGLLALLAAGRRRSAR